MERWLDVQTLIWLFPIIFMLHDLEEIVMMEKWVTKHREMKEWSVPYEYFFSKLSSLGYY